MRTGVVVGALLIALSTGRLGAQQPAGPAGSAGPQMVGRTDSEDGAATFAPDGS